MVTTAQKDLASLKQSEQWIYNERRQLVKLMLSALKYSASPLEGLMEVLGMVKAATDNNALDMNKDLIAYLYAMTNSLLATIETDLTHSINCWNLIEAEAELVREITNSLPKDCVWKVVSADKYELIDTGYSPEDFWELFIKVDPNKMYLIFYSVKPEAFDWKYSMAFCPSRMKGGENVTA